MGWVGWGRAVEDREVLRGGKGQEAEVEGGAVVGHAEVSDLWWCSSWRSAVDHHMVGIDWRWLYGSSWFVKSAELSCDWSIQTPTQNFCSGCPTLQFRYTIK